MAKTTIAIRPPRDSIVLRILGFCLLISSPLLMGWSTFQLGSPTKNSLMIGFGASMAIAIFLIRQYGCWRAILQRIVLVLPILSLCWFWSNVTIADWTSHFIIGCYLLIPLLFLSVQELHASSIAKLRRARLLVKNLAERTTWPVTLGECRKLPEVKLLKESTDDEPSPALLLLNHPKPQVRLVALTSMEFRRTLKRSYAQIVLQAAHHSNEPLIRAAALLALANLNDAEIVTGIMPFLRDSSREVRQAAAEVLLWNAMDQWLLIRPALRGNLNDTRLARDGALPCLAPLPFQAIQDLSVWAGETGSAGQRSILTLIRYYQRVMQSDPSPDLVKHMRKQLLDEKAPSAVRVEVAHILKNTSVLNREDYKELLAPHHPGAVRLVAVEALLREGHNPQVIEVLQEVAKQPNREIALQAAIIVQNSLRIDMGLPIGQAPPDPLSRQAAEITRKVLQWAQYYTTSPSTGTASSVKNLSKELPIANPLSGEVVKGNPTPWVW